MTKTQSKPEAPKAETAKTYYATSTGWIAGQYLKAGAPISLTPTAAKYEAVSTDTPKASGKVAK